jgi:hypothetical protein
MHRYLFVRVTSPTGYAKFDSLRVEFDEIACLDC